VATSINKTKQNCGGIFSLFLTGVGVYVGAYVCIRTHTHTLHVRYSDVSPGVRTTWRVQRIQVDYISAYMYVYTFTKYISI